ncbi:putative MFS-type transporter [Cyphellophora attinorum]|uniref:Putative MFS-type transporter n=1 Tax=Cyphellophora attinorum TaxID=1664694 RepID=A0A0N0NN55_9EURO|nr:putative MFS-type transporter [Phialophora attinorum]KPI41128.1 putative MFS-type transporter [Phialophora attinorum]
MWFFDPFKALDAEALRQQVYVPLEEAERCQRAVAPADHRRNSASRSQSVDLEREAYPDVGNSIIMGTLRKNTPSHGSISSFDTSDMADIELNPLTPARAHLKEEVDAEAAASGLSSVHDRKCILINKALQDIGMGRYQWLLFCGSGFGCEPTVRFATLALNVGLIKGAFGWGFLSDVIGRRIPFSTSCLLIAGLCAMGLGATTTFLQACVLIALLGSGIGGSLPVDGALLLEFLPQSSGNKLTLLSAWWPAGQLTAALLAWAFQNHGWRYLSFTLGGITLLCQICRFLLFRLSESPKFLLSKGRQDEAVAIIYAVARLNGKKTWLTSELLEEIGGTVDAEVAAVEKEQCAIMKLINDTFGRFPTQNIKSLFSNRRLAMNTLLLWIIWTAIGLGYPLFNAFLPQYLASSGQDRSPKPGSILYRDYAIASVVGWLGSPVACWAVDTRLGRRKPMAIATFFTGVFLFLFTVSTAAPWQLACSCVVSFFQTIMYGVLYSYTPETFPTTSRGTGSGIASCLNRVAGLCAPLIGIYAAATDPRIPIYVGGALISLAFMAMLFLRIETRGRTIL